jgi:hypothetical protein
MEAYLQALTGLDLPDNQKELKAKATQALQIPILCNLSACLLAEKVRVVLLCYALLLTCVRLLVGRTGELLFVCATRLVIHVERGFFTRNLRPSLICRHYKWIRAVQRHFRDEGRHTQG